MRLDFKVLIWHGRRLGMMPFLCRRRGWLALANWRNWWKVWRWGDILWWEIEVANGSAIYFKGERNVRQFEDVGMGNLDDIIVG